MAPEETNIIVLPDDAKRVGMVVAGLRALEERSPSALEQILPELQLLLRAEKSMAFGIERMERLSVGFFLGDGFSIDAVRQGVDALMEAQPGNWTGWNPDKPEPGHRNRVVRVVNYLGWRRLERIPLYHQVFRPFGLAERDQLRTLICDGDSVLAWVGVLRPEPFTAYEARVFNEIIPALKDRVLLEHRLREAAIDRVGMAACLEAIPMPVYIIRSDGVVRHANTAGQAELARDRHAILDRLRDSLRGNDSSLYRVTRLQAAGLPEYHLAMRRGAPSDATPQLTVAARRWRLTPRQIEVLQWLVKGAATKTIASELSCSTRTVEAHITAILDKAERDSRAELVALFWTLA